MATYAAWSLAMLLGLGSPALANDCRLALVLALDVSASVDSHEDRLQREGLARALVAPEVVRAFLAGAPVALYVFEWSGPLHQVTFPPGWQMAGSAGRGGPEWSAQAMLPRCMRWPSASCAFGSGMAM